MGDVAELGTWDTSNENGFGEDLTSSCVFTKPERKENGSHSFRRGEFCTWMEKMLRSAPVGFVVLQMLPDRAASSPHLL